ncbi:MoxR family ATPase, partial [Ruminococcus sp.]|uniref:ATP-binding protein n=1 Tax=Ruminococcus sp. TaxID=41978 RepID=UPI0025901FA6
MKEEIKLTNVPQISVGELVAELSNSYCTIIKNGGKMKDMPSVMLLGPPGVGKSQSVRQIAEVIERKTGKKTAVMDVRLLLFNPIDLRGIPTANDDKTLAVWLKPKIFQMDESENVVNLLFLDEISAAPQSVQAAAYQITLDRVVGEHRLPDNCIVIAAGNRTTDKSVAYKMPKALANRLLHIDLKMSFSSWKKWAVNNGVNPMVIGYLTYKNDALMRFDAASEELAFATPRSWEMVSNILNQVNSSVADVFNLIAGLVGVGMATEFSTWCDVYKDMPDVVDIFEGKGAVIPKKTDELYALTAAMSAYASKHRDELDKIENSLVFAEKLPPDFSVVLLKNYMCIEKRYREKLMRCPTFLKWVSKKGSLLNGSI